MSITKPSSPLSVGKRCSQLGDNDDALSHVLGYTCLNDVSARDLQKSDVQFTRAKGFDSFCPVGPTFRRNSIRATRSWKLA